MENVSKFLRRKKIGRAGPREPASQPFHVPVADTGAMLYVFIIIFL